jgi:ring-1,2-phenylacetyl-CoA epoxidase subunit PaaE
MSVHFYNLQIAAINRETADSVVITLQIPTEWQSQFTFTQGQSITVKATINNQEVRRSYSICSAPHQNILQIGIKKVPGGVFSTYANESLAVGQTLAVMPPMGKFNTPLQANQQKKYLAIALGSGITPILSIIKQTLYTEPQSQFTLLYGNKNRGSIMFFDALEALKNTYMQRLQCVHVLSREKTNSAINFGRITPEKLTQLQSFIPYKSFNEIFLCGPQEMVQQNKAYFEQLGIPNNQIHFELFGTTKTKTAATKNINNEANGASTVTIIADGRSTSFAFNLTDTNILDAAMAQGADLPYACKGGVCCTCKCKLVSGQVNMEVNWGLEHEEIAQGYILSCQAYPTTPEVTVDFDVK